MEPETSQPSARRLQGYVLALTATAVGVGATLALVGYRVGNVWVLIAICITAAVADRASVRVSDALELSISPVLTLFAAVLFGPLAGGLVGAASEMGDAELFSRHERGRSPHLKWLTYTSTRFMTGAAMGLTAEAVRGRMDGTAGLVVATVVASAVGELLEITFASITLRVRGKPTAILRMIGPLMATAICFYAPVVAALALAYHDLSPWSAFLFLAPALAAQRLFGMYQAQRALAERFEAANVSFAVALVTALEASDSYTAGHSRAVAIYSRDIADRMDLPRDVCDRAYLCGLVHDIGKVGLPASLLGKEGPLTLEERRIMQDHSAIGERILREVDAYDDVATVVRYHHERIDGEGYPDGIQGESIPLLSRIIAVADAYNAMTSDRPYRDGMPSRVARLRLAQAVENQFDTSVVAAFEAILATSDDLYRTAQRDDFRPGQPSVFDDADSPAAAVGAA
jgi:HD-GYP domain-containing protein (c-di-GMP phosphodiesterase class II)